MGKAMTNYIVDALMGLSFLVTGITGLVLFFFLPSGVRQGGYQEFLGIVKNSWVSVHNWAGIIMIIAVLAHLVLHWNWMVCMTKSFIKRKGK